MPQKIDIIISNELNLLNTIRFLSEVNPAENLELILEIKCRGFIKADVYLLIVSFVNNMRANGVKVDISLICKEDCNAVKYASRIDFFKHLDIPYNETIKRHNVTGSLIPITNIANNVWGLSDEILSIFRGDFKMSEEDVQQLSLIINEMICNTTIHSKCKSGAYLYCQKYKGAANHLEFILVDSGIGINQSLQKNEDFIDISNKESVSKAIEYEVTCGEGHGHGLYFASEFVKRNNGEMILVSGDDRIVVKNGTVNGNTNHVWNGVYLKFLFKFDSVVSLVSLMEEKEYDV
jgi:hypothetical protein